MNAVTMFASTLGQVFQPLFQAMAWLMALFYALVPNYAIAIALLTVVVMIVTAPLTVKSTRSMMAMQTLAPEMKKLQQKYKADKQLLNEEMMKLYREHGVNPVGGCLPMVIQFPIFIILYDVIRGLTNTVKSGHYYSSSAGKNVLCQHGPCSSPRYIGHSTKLYASLLRHNGKMPAFGIDLASKVLGHHSITQALPYALLILVAIALMYLQTRQLNSRNPQMAQANPQAQMMQRYMPIMFALIYINIAAGVNIYFIVSSLCRIGIQEGVFRSGVLAKPPPTGGESEEVLPGVGGKAAKPHRRTFMERMAEAQKRALEQQAEQRERRAAIEREAGMSKKPQIEPGKGPSASVAPKQGPSGSVEKPEATRNTQRPPGEPAGGAPERDAPTTKGTTNSPSPQSPSPNGAPPKKVAQSRSRAKRGRKAR
jgi:YidC/Oxa1 family membrane protein insertase